MRFLQVELVTHKRQKLAMRKRFQPSQGTACIEGFCARRQAHSHSGRVITSPPPASCTHTQAVSVCAVCGVWRARHRFYTAQLVMALQYMHSDNIIYRGVVPDNLLIDLYGYLKLVDFGFAKRVPPNDDDSDGKTFTLCGTAEYLAPEIVNSKGHGKGADW